ncbi:MAG: DUF3450 family protein [Planctomycetota bacterium]|jgi:hypothetical protein
MRKRLIHLSFLLFGLGGVGLLTHQVAAAPQAIEAGNDGRPTRLMGRLQELVRQLRELRQDYYTQKTQDDAEIEAAQRDCDLLKSQVEDLGAQEASLDTELSDYRAQIRDLEEQLETKAVVRAVVDRELAAFTSAQARQIEAGVPYKQQERIARLRAGLPDPNAAAVFSVAERLGHLWSYAQEELRLAGSSETYTDRAVVEEDALPYARYFRVGQLMLGYVTEDAREAAMWLDSPTGGRWRAISDPKQLAQLRDAAEILDRRQAPRFVSLPIVLDVPDPDEKSP